MVYSPFDFYSMYYDVPITPSGTVPVNLDSQVPQCLKEN